MSKLHGYKRHVVSDFAVDRHPYIEEENLKKTEGVFRSTYSRVIPNLKNVLNNPASSDEDRQEAILILNEMSNH